MFYIGLAAQLRGIGLDAALIHRQSTDEPFLRTYFSLRLGLDVIAFGALLGLTPLIQQLNPHVPALSSVMMVLVVTYFLSSLAQAQEALLRKHLAFGRLAITDVAASATMTLVAPALAWLGWGVWALVAEQVVGIAVRLLLLWGPFRQRLFALGWAREQARWLWEYGKPTWVASNLSFLLDRFDDFWIGTTLGETPLGLYARAYELAHYPRRVLANPLVSVFAPAFARLQDDRLRLSQAFFRSAFVITRSSVFVAGAFALAMPEFIRYVIGEQWQPMLVTFWLMLIYTVLDPIVMLMTHFLLAIGQPAVLQRANIVQALFFVPAVVIGAWLAGINGVAIAANGMLILGALALYPALKREADFAT
ncbi:MAG: oligosaccharide flippase family protein, partial [Thermoflexales bacterium]|nr:oligosaccharide flippase family protein [Thermoflexales bacterium]